MVNFTILAGGFTSFIATYVFDSDAGSLELVKQNPTGQNPSWIASHPLNSSVLYAVNEIGPVGALQSFIVDEQGSLSLINTVSTGGNGPTFTNPLTTGEVTGMNFGSPNSSFIATDPDDPSLFVETDSPFVSFPVDGGPSNPHMSLEFNGEVFVPDLGADKIWRIVSDGEAGFKVQGQIDVAPGNGPRHIAIKDNILFILHEKTSVLTAQPIPAAPNGTTLPVLANVSIVPPEAANFNGSFFAAEIVISEKSEAFGDSLIYVSNRNLGPEFDEQGDSIAIFEYSALTSGGPLDQNGTATASTTATGSEASPTATTSGSSSAASTTLTASDGSPLAGEVFTTLVAAVIPEATTTAASSVPAKRMLKLHARRRVPHDNARRQYDAEVPSGSSEALTVVPTPTSSASASGSATSTATEGGAPILVPTPTPTAVTLTLVNQVFTGLRQIRSFAIGRSSDGGDEFLIAGANLDGGVAVFKRTEGGRNLELVARNEELQSRTSFVFL